MNKNKTPQQQQYKLKKDAISNLQDYVDAAAKSAVERWKTQHPEYPDLSVKPMNRVYVKNKAGITRAIIHIARILPLMENLSKTQAAILKEVQEGFPESKLSANIWNKPLNAAVLKNVEQAVLGNRGDIPINLKGCNTLSSIRKRIKKSYTINVTKNYKFKADITFTAAAVFLGNVSYPLVMRKSGNSSYPCIRVNTKDKRVWVRADALVAMLKAGKQ